MAQWIKDQEELEALANQVKSDGNVSKPVALLDVESVANSERTNDADVEGGEVEEVWELRRKR